MRGARGGVGHRGGGGRAGSCGRRWTEGAGRDSSLNSVCTKGQEVKGCGPSPQNLSTLPAFHSLPAPSSALAPSLPCPGPLLTCCLFSGKSVCVPDCRGPLLTCCLFSGKSVSLTIWGDNASMPGLDGLEGEGAVLQVTACRVTDYNGGLGGGGGGYTYTHVQVTACRVKYSNGGQGQGGGGIYTHICRVTDYKDGQGVCLWGGAYVHTHAGPVSHGIQRWAGQKGREGGGAHTHTHRCTRAHTHILW